MPLRKHEPVSEREMCRVSPFYSICEVLREIYHKSSDPEIKLKARIATAMAKSMSNKLTEYNGAWKKGFFDLNLTRSEKRERNKELRSLAKS